MQVRPRLLPQEAGSRDRPLRLELESQLTPQQVAASLDAIAHEFLS